jgi:2-oxoglutarate/2-oxoacid ferredoxin oxidoreductase subunit alpha
MNVAQVTNDFVINIATVNGSGSQSANTILLKTLFRMGIPVGGKNVFPSNIQGLPTWFWIRASKDGYTGRRKEADIVVAMNPQTVIDDNKVLKSGGVFIYNTEMKFDISLLRKDALTIGVPFKQIVDQATTQGKIKKLLANIIYVGVLAEVLQLDSDALMSALSDQFGGKEAVIEVNKKTMELGREYARNNLNLASFPFRAEKMSATKNKVMIDGNTAAALGLIYGGATFAAWYPITPSSSLVENFIKYGEKLRKTPDGKNNYAVVQAEDELASICMVLGAGWAGSRAFTATSGPGISLMQEASGFAYYTEIPSVIWDIQRVGPSTGMPTRTSQSDFFSTTFASHGDTKHPCLIPGTAAECFEFGQTCFDLAERLQTMIFVMSDLDLGMNLWMEDEFPYPTKPFDRGKVLDEQALAKFQNYYRYQDPDQDGIAYRTLPGTRHPAAPYVIRGSGHGVKAQYTERGDEYSEIVDRLSRKWETAKSLVPKPVIDASGAKIGIIAYGSAESPMKEARDLLKKKSLATDYLRLRALPLTNEVKEFIASHEKTYVIDLNRDAQMKSILTLEWPEYHEKLVSLRHYEGTPITADVIADSILSQEKRVSL